MNTAPNTLLGKEVKLGYDAIESQVKFLQGKVLTVVDASYTNINERQLKAVKDLINKSFSEQLNWISKICFPDLRIMSREEAESSGIDLDKVERGAVEVK